MKIGPEWTDARIRTLFVKTSADSYGPKATNPVYAITVDGVTYTVKRKHWVLPFNHWGWVAKADGVRAIYGDTLAGLALDLGLMDDEEAQA